MNQSIKEKNYKPKMYACLLALLCYFYFGQFCSTVDESYQQLTAIGVPYLYSSLLTTRVQEQRDKWCSISLAVSNIYRLPVLYRPRSVTFNHSIVMESTKVSAVFLAACANNMSNMRSQRDRATRRVIGESG